MKQNQTDTTSSTKPSVVINRFPENQTLFSRLPLVPGKNHIATPSQINATSRPIFTDGIPRAIRKYEFNISFKKC